MPKLPGVSSQLPPRPVRPLDTSDVVLTPGGLRPRSLVHALQPGEHVSTLGGRVRIVETATGNVVKDLGESASASKKEAQSAEDKSSEEEAESSAPIPTIPDVKWILNSQWHNTTEEPIVYFSTTWIVPPAPASNDGQTIFLFNALQPDSAAHILQPVLQWGYSQAGGAWVWSITNWYADGTGGPAAYAPLTEVGTGDVLTGVMTCTGMSGSNGFNYTCKFTGYPSCDLVATDVEQLTWAFETLECYGADFSNSLTQCSDYPNTKYTAMYNIEIRTGLVTEAGTDAPIEWTAIANFRDCGQFCAIASNASPGGEVDLYYSEASWQQLDNNPACSAIVADGAELYQRHNNGQIWKYTRPAMFGWQELDSNPKCSQIAAAAGALFQLHTDGTIWQYVGPQAPGWIALDTNPATVEIAASGNNLYQRHSTGSIWKYTWNADSGWQLLDNNPHSAFIVADGNALYQLRSTGDIWQFVGPAMADWVQLDSNPACVEIAASGGKLYQRHNDGTLWLYIGTPITGWQQLDNNPATIAMAADGTDFFYQIHTDGTIWRYLGTPLTGWQMLGQPSSAVAIAASGGQLYRRHSSGDIWKFL